MGTIDQVKDIKVLPDVVDIGTMALRCKEKVYSAALVNKAPHLENALCSTIK